MTAATIPHLASRTGPDAVALAGQVGRAVAGPAAPRVDRESRFPSEAIAALREARLMSVLVPVRYGGLGC